MNFLSMIALVGFFAALVGGLAWLHNKEPSWALMAVIVMSVLYGLAGGGSNHWGF